MAERLTSEKKSFGRYLVASWVKVRELQVECEALSGSLDESCGTAERVQLSETTVQERVRYLETELAALKRKGEAELATLKRNGKASVACLEQLLYEGLC
jgi:hypothetical protein